MAHDAAVVLGSLFPSPFVLALWGDVVMHDVYELPALPRLFATE